MIFLKQKISLVLFTKRKATLFFLIVGLFFCNNALAQRNTPQGDNNQNGSSRGGDKIAELQQVRKIPKDSLLIFSYTIDNPNQEFAYRDTLLDSKFHQFDPARNRLLDYGTLGYMGSPLNQLFYQPNFHQGFEVGLHQYDLYKTNIEDLRFYNIKTAYSDFFFSQGGAQDDIQLKAKFSRNFSNNMNLSLDYHRISQYGTTQPIDYFYQNQRARHTAIAGGMAFRNNTNTYQSFFAFSNNIHQQEDNGGIQADSFFFQQEDGFNSPLAIPVWLDNAETRHDEQEISYTQYYIFNPNQYKANKKRKAEEKARAIEAAKAAALRDSITRSQMQIDTTYLIDSLGNPTDSIISIDTIHISPIDTLGSKMDSLSSQIDTLNLDTITNDSIPNQRPRQPQRPGTRPLPPSPPTPVPVATGRSYTLSHRIAYKRGIYKFSDIAPSADSLYWKNLWLDQRGLRHYLVTRKIENKIAISTFKPRESGRSKAQDQSDYFEIGIRHSFNWVDEEAADSTINNLFLSGKWNFAPSERLKIKTYAHLGLWDNAGDYRISGDLFFDLKKIGQLKLSGVNQLYSPSILQQRFYISQRAAWNNDFRPTLETSLSATYALPKIGFQATGKYNLINNLIYYDTLVTPQQEGAPASIFQLILEQNFTLRKFHLDNVIVLQQTTNDVLSLPSFFSKHSFYYQGKWFKQALQIRLGADLRMNNNYFANNYNPLVGQFYLQDANRLEFFPAIDTNVSIKVRQFRFFVKMENMTRLFGNLLGSVPKNYQYYQVDTYPIQNSRLRFGLAWKFVN